MIKSYFLFIFSSLIFISFSVTNNKSKTTLVEQQKKIRLLVRADDMGFSHAANLACIEACKKGIARSVEVMVPGPWFEETVLLLNEAPEIDVGIHLILSSEWQKLKWRPLTLCPSLVDEDGYFFPMIWKNNNNPDGDYLENKKWKIGEMEAELRAQIELGIKKIPHTSHLSAHMGCLSLNDETQNLLKKLAKVYGLKILDHNKNIQWAPDWSGHQFSKKEKEKQFIKMLNNLSAGDWITVEHPGYDWEELKNVSHPGYENVAEDRAAVTAIFTSKKIKKIIRQKNIQLISYRDLK